MRARGVSGGTVVVRGHAAVPAEPDHLQVTLTVSAVMSTPDGALAEAGRLNAELGRVLDELAVGACDRSQSGLTVREEFERIEGRWARRGYRAANAVAVRMAEPSQVPGLLGAAVGRAGAQVDGPRWRCRPEHPARAEACRQAAADARRRPRHTRRRWACGSAPCSGWPSRASTAPSPTARRRHRCPRTCGSRPATWRSRRRSR